MNRRIAVTGSRGLLGGNFLWAAHDQWEVFALHRSRAPVVPGVTGVFLDLSDFTGIRSVLDKIKPSVILHLAAATGVDWCEGNRAEAVLLNVRVTEAVARWSAENCAKMVLMSTDSVFDGKRGLYRETDTPNPVNFYAQTKLMAEAATVANTSDYLILRANFYGWNGEPKRSLAEWILAEIGNGNIVPGFQDVRFSPLLANTLSEIMLQMIDRDARGLYHVASADRISKYDFALLIAEIFRKDDALIRRALLSESSLIAKRPLDTSLRTERLRKELGLSVPFVRIDLERMRALEDTAYVFKLKNSFGRT